MLCFENGEECGASIWFPAGGRIDLDFELKGRISLSLCYGTVTYTCVSTRHYTSGQSKEFLGVLEFCICAEKLTAVSG